MGLFFRVLMADHSPLAVRGVMQALHRTRLHSRCCLVSGLVQLDQHH